MASIDTVFADLEARTELYVNRINQIDRILLGPLGTLITQAQHAAEAQTGAPVIPQWFTRTRPLDRASSRVGSSLSVVTLQRVHMFRRRFPGLTSELKQLSTFVRNLSQRYLPDRNQLGDEAYFEACCRLTDSYVHGVLNPVTGAQVFRVLMETGEDRAHSGAGCATFFAMVWPLFRYDPDEPLDLGARIEPGHASAYVTAKCVLPLIQLREICRGRARLTLKVRDNVDKLHQALRHAAASLSGRWQFCSTLSDLVTDLKALAPLSIGAQALSAASGKFEALNDSITRETNLEGIYDTVLLELRSALELISRKNVNLVADARVVLERLAAHVVEPLSAGDVPTEVAGCKLGFWLAEDARHRGYDSYVRILGEAAADAFDLCDGIVSTLDGASDLPLPTQADGTDAVRKGVLESLKRLAAVNTRVGETVHEPVEQKAMWLHAVANREIAFTSADNDTDFDPAELISAIAVGVRTNKFTTPVQLTDALRKAVLGAQRDGSWRLLHPYYSGDGALVIRPPAADVVWTLVSAVSHFPEIDVADDTLFRFVDWLERTQREIAVPEMSRLNEAYPDAYVGWSSDQMRHDHRISLIHTAYAINALLGIRDLAEHRIWELCKRRFTIVSDVRSLSEMDPVDLLVPHKHRMHRMLWKMSSDTQRSTDDALYSLVLHGPPGSSKTAVAGALAKQLWRRSKYWNDPDEPIRLVRVTPADFTRRGEAHVESEAQLIFRMLSRVRGVTVLFDEIDDLLRRRVGDQPQFLDLVIPAMLNRLQDLRDVCKRQEICFLFGTNYVERIEPALMRRGRIDRVIPVSYPDFESRVVIAERVLAAFDVSRRQPQGDALWQERWSQTRVTWCEEIARATAGWPWSAITAACKEMNRRLDSTMDDLQRDDLPLNPDEIRPKFEAFQKRALAENNPESQTSASYINRLRKRPDSPELRREAFYGALAMFEKHYSADALSRHLHLWIEGSFDDATDEGLKRQLCNAIVLLPHFADANEM